MKHLHTLAALLALAAVACGPARPGTTTTTSADLTDLSGIGRGSMGSPTTTEAGEPAVGQLGQLVCRTKSMHDGTSELFLEWSGEGAKGELRKVVPSGMVYVQRVHAERYKGAIIADEPGAIDLVSHVAVVGRQDGKQYMRLGDRHQPWLLCE